MSGGTQGVPDGVDGVDGRHIGPPTPTEIAVIRGLAHGKSRKQMARELEICYTTLARHLYNVQRKLGAQSAEQMVYMAMKQGLIE